MLEWILRNTLGESSNMRRKRSGSCSHKCRNRATEQIRRIIWISCSLKKTVATSAKRKTEIERRAINIPRGYQLEGLVVEIHITNCDGTRHKKIHKMDGPDSDRILRKAHARSIRNKEQVEQSEICGCFSCCRIFPPSEITAYIPDEPPTAECPYCHIDSVIGDASGFPITKEFLKKMKKRWF